MIDKRDVTIFLKTVIVTAVAVLVFAGGYFAVCKTYEAMQKTLFGDSRSAVIVGEGYIKFFDWEYISE